MRKQLYLAIKEHIKAITDENGEQVFKHFDLWNKQVEFIEQETPFAMPAVFIEFRPIMWDTLGEGNQKADATVVLHIVTHWFGQTADYSPIEEESLSYLDLADLLHQHMEGFTIDDDDHDLYAGAFMRSASNINHDHSEYVDSSEEYGFNLMDATARHRPQMWKGPLTAQVTVRH